MLFQNTFLLNGFGSLSSPLGHTECANVLCLLRVLLKVIPTNGENISFGHIGYLCYLTRYSCFSLHEAVALLILVSLAIYQVPGYKE